MDPQLASSGADRLVRAGPPGPAVARMGSSLK